MRNLRHVFLTGIILSAPLPAGATSITEDFGITSPFAGPLPTTLFSTAFPQFNPSLGVLDEIVETLTGSAMWTSSSGAPSLEASFVNITPASQTFSSPGTIDFNMTGTTTDPSTLANFTGHLLAFALLRLSTPTNVGDTFATTGTLSGVITYDFTPVPEPASLTLLGSGAVLLALLARRKGKLHAIIFDP